MNPISKVVILILLMSLGNVETLAKTVTVLDFEKTPFSGKVSEKEIQKLINKGGIRATVAVPTYVSLLVDGVLVSGVAPKGTEAVFVPNEDNDYYTLVPIVGGVNVSVNQKTDDFISAPHIQLVWYRETEEHDAAYTLISLAD